MKPTRPEMPPSTQTRYDRDSASDGHGSDSGQQAPGAIKLLVGCVVFVASIALAFFASQVNAAPINGEGLLVAGFSSWLIWCGLLLIAFVGMRLFQRSVTPPSAPLWQNSRHSDECRPDGRGKLHQGSRHRFPIYRDELTPEEFLELFKRYWSNCSSQSSYLALSIVQIDDFSQMSDAFGHLEMLERFHQVNRSLQSLTRSRGGIISKTAPSQHPGFQVLLPNTTPDDALETAEEMRLAVEDLGYPGQANGRGIMTATLGAAITVPDQASTSDALLMGAQRALERAQQLGCNRVVIEMLDEKTTG